MKIPELNIGVVGAGGFAKFALQAFLQVPGIKVIAVTDIFKQSALSMGEEFGLKVYDTLDEMLLSRDTNLIYIATPPYLHYLQSKMAMLAGKHVICEKPAALKTSEAEELVEMAGKSGLLYVVNLMQRYNPLFNVVDTIVKEKILGNFLHGFFENYASDEFLGPDHWFWDKHKSGGIFIEHGVHFFDLFTGWLGVGKVVNALECQRPNVKEMIVDRVQATVLYKEGFVNFYHGFDQPKILDRQEMRLLFEHGEITLYEWVPTKMKFNGLVSEEQIQKLKMLIHPFKIIHQIGKADAAGKVHGRFKAIQFKEQVTIDFENSSDKEHLYQKMLIGMITDQQQWVGDEQHTRVINGDNAVESLRLAEQATLNAVKY
jgi:predicted dehydrogenase